MAYGRHRQVRMDPAVAFPKGPMAAADCVPCIAIPNKHHAAFTAPAKARTVPTLSSKKTRELFEVAIRIAVLMMATRSWAEEKGARVSMVGSEEYLEW